MSGPSGLRRFVPGAEPAAPAAQELLPGAPAAVLDRIRAARPGAQQSEESCEMCAAAILPQHGHIADLEQSSLLCTCRPCYLLFEHTHAGGGRYRAVPDRYLHDPAHPMTAAEWDELEIPVGLAFFLSQSGQVAGFYPSPAGPTECRLDLTAWDRVAGVHPLLSALEPDVEAVLISRTGDTVEHFLVPIDACYELAGRMRMLWKGFDGGTEALASISEFLGGVRSRARAFSQEPS